MADWEKTTRKQLHNQSANYEPSYFLPHENNLQLNFPFEESPTCFGTFICFALPIIAEK